jgi:predicted metal-binding protein
LYLCKKISFNMKAGIIRCRQTEDLCPGTGDFKVAKAGKGAFENVGESEVIGFVSCGGCPGKRAVARAKNMVERGVEVIAFASCIGKGTPLGFPCPHAEQMMEAVAKAVGNKVIILDYTH